MGYEVATEIDFWLEAPKTIRNVCFLMVTSHRLKTIGLRAGTNQCDLSALVHT